MKTIILIIVFFSIFLNNLDAQLNNSNISQNNIKVDGDNIVITTPQGDVKIQKIYINNAYKWVFSDEDRIKWSKEVSNAIENILSDHFGEVNIIKKDINDIKTILIQQKNNEIILKNDSIIMLNNRVCFLNNKLDTLNALSQLLYTRVNILEGDKANWWQALIPGVRQYNLGYKHAYVYWGGGAVALVSIGIGHFHYNKNYQYFKEELGQTNNPNDEDYYRKKMDTAKKARDNSYKVGAIVGGFIYGVNLIDALFVSKRRKAFPKNLTIFATTEYEYGGISISYNF